MTDDKIKEKVKDVAFYVVVNSDGQFYRRKGYNGSGNTGVDTVQTARVYIKIAQARSIVTFFAVNYKDFPPPRILKLTVAGSELIDETERLEVAKVRKQRKLETQELRSSKYRLEQAKRDFEKAQAKYEQRKTGRK
jgi:hypothetical protein